MYFYVHRFTTHIKLYKSIMRRHCKNLKIKKREVTVEQSTTERMKDRASSFKTCIL